VDLTAEQKLGEALARLRGTVASAHDLSEGGLSQAVVEYAVQSGASVSVDPVAGLAATATTGEAVADLFTGTVLRDRHARARRRRRRRGGEGRRPSSPSTACR
jgi:phosphoribosylformylglycinamidine (FGAM) synthase-like enzyme